MKLCCFEGHYGSYLIIWIEQNLQKINSRYPLLTLSKSKNIIWRKFLPHLCFWHLKSLSYNAKIFKHKRVLWLKKKYRRGNLSLLKMISFGVCSQSKLWTAKREGITQCYNEGNKFRKMNLPKSSFFPFHALPWASLAIKF